MESSRLLLSICLCLVLIFFVSVITSVSAENENTATETLTVPPDLTMPIPIQTTGCMTISHNINSAAGNAPFSPQVILNNTNSLNSGFTNTGMKTMGEQVMVPITPTPEGMGYHYLYPDIGNVYWIYSPGTYVLGEGFSSTNSGINISASNVTLDGNEKRIIGSGNGYGVVIDSETSNITVKNFAEITGFTDSTGSIGPCGILSFGNNTSMKNNNISLDFSGIHNYGNYVNITDNNLSGNTKTSGIWSIGNSISISGNNLTNNGFGILSYGDDLITTGNNIHNNQIGIYKSGNNTKITGNTGQYNKYDIYSLGSNGVISGNNVSNSSIRGITLFGLSFNTTITGNKINNSSYGLEITRDGTGKIYNNFFGNTYNVKESGDEPQYTWTNPAGPTSGSNVVGGPFIAGNYWSDPNGTGWSDKQPGNPKGYTTVQYEVFPGANDIAPLVRTQNITTHTIEASNSAGGSINPFGQVIVIDRSNQTFAINPNTGYLISDVIVDGLSAGAVPYYTFYNVTTNHTINAFFNLTPPETYKITALAGIGGTIVPNGSVMVNTGDNQTFTISPNTSYQIDNVLVDGSSVGKVSTYTFANVTSDHTITASFSSSLTHNITATAGPGGSISPSGTVVVPDGGNQTFAINPNSGYLIQDILVDGSSVGALSTYTFANVTGDHRIYASFSQVTPLNYTIIASAGSGGRIIPNGSVQVAAGANQTFNISNNLGMVIDTVMVDNVSQGAIRSYTFYNVSANHTISASFKVLYPTTWYINATAGTGGSIDPSGLVRVFNGYNKTFLITALSCYDITDVIINNAINLGPQVSPFQYNFTSVTSNQSIEALFTQKIYIINATAGIGGKISPKGEISVPCGGDQTFAISPDTNYDVISVFVDGLDKGAIRSYTFSNVTVNHEISAYFTRIPGIYEINASADQYTIVYPNGIKKFQEGSNKTYITQSKPGSDLTGIKVDSTTFLPNVSWTFTNISSDHNISTMGEYTPGQVQVFFSANQTWGQAPLTVQFIDHSVGNPTSWYWQFGDGKTSISQNPVNVYEVPGTYTVTLRASSSVSGGVGIYTDMIKVTNGVVPQPTPFPTPVKITADFTAVPHKGSAPLDVSFQDQSSGNPVSWIWYFGDGQVSTLQNPTHRYSSAGSYSVTLLAQNVKYSGSISKPGFIAAI